MSGDAGDLGDYVPEGVEAIVPYKGSAVNVLRHLSEGYGVESVIVEQGTWKNSEPMGNS